jgi:hypothetical protein
MGVEFVFSTVFFIAWPSQCPSGRRRPGEFVDDGSPVADPSGRVRAVLPAVADGQEEDLHSRVDVRERPAAPDRGAEPGIHGPEEPSALKDFHAKALSLGAMGLDPMREALARV